MARVLLVDDNLPLAENLAEILQDFGHEVTVSGSGSDALVKLAGGHFDVALLDVCMPQMDGLTLAQRIEAAAPGTMTLFMSGYSNERQRATAHALSGRPILDKPLDIDCLLRLVEPAA